MKFSWCPRLHHSIRGTGNSPVLCQLFLVKSSSSISSHASPTASPSPIFTRLNWCDRHRPSEIGKMGFRVQLSLALFVRIPTLQNSLTLLTCLHILYLLEEYECPKTVSHNHFPSKPANSQQGLKREGSGYLTLTLGTYCTGISVAIRQTQQKL